MCNLQSLIYITNINIFEYMFSDMYQMLVTVHFNTCFPSVIASLLVKEPVVVCVCVCVCVCVHVCVYVCVTLHFVHVKKESVWYSYGRVI